MLSAALADAVVALHFAFIVFALLGGALLVRWPGLVLVHLPALVWGTWIEFSGGLCPLTTLENDFRAAAGAAGYGEGFVDHYLSAIIYPDGLTRGTQLVYGAILLGLNAILYLRWISKIPQRRDGRAKHADTGELADLLRRRDIDLEEREDRGEETQHHEPPHDGRNADHPRSFTFR